MSWYPVAPVAPVVEPVSLVQAKAQCRVIGTDEDDALDLYIASARAHAEAYCGAAFAERTLVARCDSFTDMARLPFAPVNSVTSIVYDDTIGTTQTLSATVYELRADGLDAAIVLKPGAAWPAVQPGSRITLSASVGTIPLDDVLHAMLLFIADSFDRREHAKAGDWTSLDSLLCNHRRGV
ncbi:phage head-tail connector protein [Sphingopyxis granuli]|uniref:head-tail connector protein n=1 Tax=Sphingopyxis granuli TaxID=267128 RepID=UPI001F53A714|nr:phage head-tail connector protein [Sphingopyxis granuli]UNK78064.1 phage head-tail connector protein [Sphingopyxis granuli]